MPPTVVASHVTKRSGALVTGRWPTSAMCLEWLVDCGLKGLHSRRTRCSRQSIKLSMIFPSHRPVIQSLAPPGASTGSRLFALAMARTT